MEHLEQLLTYISAAPKNPHDAGVEAKLSLDRDGHLTFSENDPENPKNWSLGRKCYLTGVAILLVVNATFASSAPTGTVDGISDDLKVSVEAAGLVTTLFLLGYCAGPLVWAPLSEFFGRRWIFYTTFTLYLAFNFLCAFTPTLGGLLVGRFLTGVAASSALSNGPGIISDLWGVVGRGNAMCLFMVATFCGPALGPVVSGFLQLKETWRWTFYTLLWFAGFTLLFLFTIPETLPTAILSRRARSLRSHIAPGSEAHTVLPETETRKLSAIFKIALTRPWLILFDPISFFVAIYYCVVYTLLYMLFSIYPIVFQQKRGWNAGVGELPLIGTVVGACLGGVTLFYVSTREQKAAREGRARTPEDRLPPAMVGGILFAATMFWFAWTAEYNAVPWIVPTLAGTFLATSILLVFSAFINYLVDTYLAYAASAVAANTVVRSACAASSPLWTQYMFDALGVGGGGSLVAGVAVLLAPIPFIFYWYGAPIRRRSKFTPNTE